MPANRLRRPDDKAPAGSQYRSLAINTTRLNFADRPIKPDMTTHESLDPAAWHTRRKRDKDYGFRDEAKHRPGMTEKEAATRSPLPRYRR
jgi:hypothetical protein